VDSVRWLVRQWVPLVLLWSIPGLVSTTQIYFIYQIKEPTFSFGTAFIFQFPPWQYWALVTPAVLGLGRRRRLEAGAWAPSIGVHLLFNVLLGAGHVVVLYYCGRLAQQQWYLERGLWETLPMMLGKNAHMELLTYWGILAVGHALEYHQRFRESQLAQAQLATQLAQAQLDALKMQLHPHFLFNTLNAIAVMVRKQDIPGSIRMLTGVSELLRLALHNTGRQLVPLRQELDFLDRYLEIEQTRFQDRLQVHREIDSATLSAQVPNLLLQPLVENAIKHGIAARSAAGRVELRASRQGARLRLEVRDDGPGLRPGWESSQGVGVSNVRARLRQLYGEAATFILEAHPEGGTRALLELPFKAASPEEPE
jgi:two-component system LytT family sensor kinase